MPGKDFRPLRSLFIIAVLALMPALLSAQNYNIIPLPKSIVATTGQFRLNNGAIIGINDSSLMQPAHYLQGELLKSNNLALTVDRDEANAVIDLQIVKSEEVTGAYKLKISDNKITITSASSEGVFYGVVTLIQMVRTQPLGAINLPNCEINDAPRFQWRGFMLDESRHFFGKQKVQQLLDWMAFYKLNKFHWHLTDAQGWRIEIKKYPKLAQIGGRGNYSDSLADVQYYTQQEIKEVVAYAAARFITVIPEVDMPGHATAANRAYPQYSGGVTAKYPNFTFDPSNEDTYPFLTDILKEVNALFPARMIHLGGDEVALGMQAWAGRSTITDMLVKNKFESLEDIEHSFFRRMADSVIKMNDKVLCWDEAAETNLPADKTIVFWWRQNVPSQLQLALSKKYQVVLCPRLPLYFDFLQDKSHVSGRRWSGTNNSVSSVYNFPYREFPNDQLQSPLVLGIQANLWTETVGSPKRLDFMIFPRIAALSEAAWTDPSLKNEDSFNQRLCADFPLYDKENIYYFDPFDVNHHPEAIDFAPKVVAKPVIKEKHHKHGRKERNSRHSSKKKAKHSLKGETKHHSKSGKKKHKR